MYWPFYLKLLPCCRRCTDAGLNWRNSLQAIDCCERSVPTHGFHQLSKLEIEVGFESFLRSIYTPVVQRSTVD
jgi:hypothetical protein